MDVHDLLLAVQSLIQQQIGFAVQHTDSQGAGDAYAVQVSLESVENGDTLATVLYRVRATIQASEAIPSRERMLVLSNTLLRLHDLQQLDARSSDSNWLDMRTEFESLTDTELTFTISLYATAQS